MGGPLHPAGPQDGADDAGPASSANKERASSTKVSRSASLRMRLPPSARSIDGPEARVFFRWSGPGGWYGVEGGGRVHQRSGRTIAIHPRRGKVNFTSRGFCTNY